MERTKTTWYNEKTGKVVKKTYGDWENTKTPWAAIQGLRNGTIKDGDVIDGKGNILNR